MGRAASKIGKQVELFWRQRPATMDDSFKAVIRGSCNSLDDTEGLSSAPISAMKAPGTTRLCRLSGKRFSSLSLTSDGSPKRDIIPLIRSLCERAANRWRENQPGSMRPVEKEIFQRSWYQFSMFQPFRRTQHREITLPTLLIALNYYISSEPEYNSA